MVDLFDVDADVRIGSITEDQLLFLRKHLEEESSGDQDYYLNPATLDVLREQGADAALLALLVDALGDRDDMEIRWVAG